MVPVFVADDTTSLRDDPLMEALSVFLISELSLGLFTAVCALLSLLFIAVFKFFIVSDVVRPSLWPLLVLSLRYRLRLGMAKLLCVQQLCSTLPKSEGTVYWHGPGMSNFVLSCNSIFLSPGYKLIE